MRSLCSNGLKGKNHSPGRAPGYDFADYSAIYETELGLYIKEQEYFD